MAFEQSILESELGSIDILVSEPSISVDRTVIFGGGWSSRHFDYETFLRSFAYDAKVIAVNPPNHQKSDGDFTLDNYVTFLQVVTKAYGKGQVIGVGHSSGGTAIANADFENVVLLNPYVNQSYLAPPMKKAVSVCDVAKHVPFFPELAKAVYMNEKHNFHMRDPIQSSAELKRFEMKPIHSKVVLFSTDDELHDLGTDEKRAAYVGHIKHLSRMFVDMSSRVKGLNHCFNEEGYVPFCKDEKIADAIAQISYESLQ